MATPFELRRGAATTLYIYKTELILLITYSPAVKSHFHSVAHEIIDNEIESVWCTIKQRNKRSIHVCSFYRPPNSEVDIIYQIENQISEFTQRDNKSVIVIGGDISISYINWDTYTVKPNSRNREISNFLFNVLANHSSPSS